MAGAIPPRPEGRGLSRNTDEISYAQGAKDVQNYEIE